MEQTRQKLLSILFLLFISTVASAAGPDEILGRYWSPDKDRVIEIFLADGAYQGRIIWSKKAIKDKNNLNESLKERELLGLVFLTGFRFDGKNRWLGGRVYAPDNGRTYKGKLWVENNNLKMRGYVGVSLLGRTATLQMFSENDSLPTGGFVWSNPTEI